MRCASGCSSFERDYYDDVTFSACFSMLMIPWWGSAVSDGGSRELSCGGNHARVTAAKHHHKWFCRVVVSRKPRHCLRCEWWKPWLQKCLKWQTHLLLTKCFSPWTEYKWLHFDVYYTGSEFQEYSCFTHTLYHLWLWEWSCTRYFYKVCVLCVTYSGTVFELWSKRKLVQF